MDIEVQGPAAPSEMTELICALSPLLARIIHTGPDFGMADVYPEQKAGRSG